MELEEQLRAHFRFGLMTARRLAKTRSRAMVAVRVKWAEKNFKKTLSSLHLKEPVVEGFFAATSL